MISFALGAFWVSVGVVAYTYVGFPIVLAARSVVLRRPHGSADIFPTVTVIIAAHNEEAVIGPKLENTLALTYKPGLVEILVASDGSDDGTNEIVESYADRGVMLLALPRVGKQVALNEAVARAGGEIVVFSDANSMYAADALVALVRPFADESVGGVAGDQRYLDSAELHTGSSGEQSYWSFDRLLRAAESDAGHVIAATGAIYAMRRELVDEIPAGVMDDFFISTGAIAKGHRLVFAPGALAYEPVASSGGREYRRKVRNITLGLAAVAERRVLLDPRRHGFYALQLLSHKVLRRLMAVPLIVIAVATPVLLRRGRLYRAVGAAQLAFYASGLLGLARPHVRGPVARVVKLPAYFCLVNAAALEAIWNLLRGRRINRWDPEREVPPEPGADQP